MATVSLSAAEFGSNEMRAGEGSEALDFGIEERRRLVFLARLEHVAFNF